MTTTRVIMSNPWHKLSKADRDDSKKDLSEIVEKVARKELREDKYTRDQCLAQMRDWLAKNEDVQDVRMDEAFLLRFLRAKKFSVPMAQQMLLKYLNLKTIFPGMTTNLDFLSSPIKEIFANGYLVSWKISSTELLIKRKPGAIDVSPNSLSLEFSVRFANKRSTWTKSYLGESW